MMKKRSILHPGFLLGLIFCIVGIGMLIGGITAFIAGANMRQGLDEVTGMVIDKDEYAIYVEYRYMARDYEDELSFYSDLLKVGDKMELYIDPLNPDEAETSMGSGLVGGIFLFMGAVFTFMGGVAMSMVGFGKRKSKKLKETGRKIYAEVTGGKICYNYSVNGRHPFKLECKYVDQLTQNVYLYSSNYTWDDPEAFVGQQIAVYVEQNDMSKYYVDLDSLQNPMETYQNVVHDFR